MKIVFILLSLVSSQILNASVKPHSRLFETASNKCFLTDGYQVLQLNPELMQWGKEIFERTKFLNKDSVISDIRIEFEDAEDWKTPPTSLSSIKNHIKSVTTTNGLYYIIDGHASKNWSDIRRKNTTYAIQESEQMFELV